MVPNVFKQINDIKKKIKLLFFLNGFSKVIIYVFIFSILTFGLDWLIRDIPVGVRLTFLIAGISGFIYVIYRHLIYALQKKITNNDIAVVIEKKFPELNGRFISAIQFKMEPENYNIYSKGLINQTIDDAIDIWSRKTKEKKILNYRPILWSFSVSIFVLFLSTLFTVIYPDLTSLWAKRLLGSELMWPSRTNVKLEIDENPILLAEGGQFKLSASVSGLIPRKGYLYYTIGKSSEEFVKISKIYERKVDFIVEDVKENFTFYVKCGDGKTGFYDVIVKPAPVIRELNVWYDYSEYTGLKDTPKASPETSANLNAPEGTAIKIVGYSNLALIEGKLFTGWNIEPTQIKILKSNKKKYPGMFEINILAEKSGEYYIKIKAENGFENKNPIRHYIKVKEDKAPEIIVYKPGRNKICTINAVYELNAKLSDDYGIKQINLLYSVNDSKEQNSILVLDNIAANQYSSRSERVTPELNIKSMKLKVGDTLLYRFQASDFRKYPGENQTKSRAFSFKIVSKADMEQDLNERIIRFKTAIEKLHNLQEDMKKKLVNIITKSEIAKKDAGRIIKDISAGEIKFTGIVGLKTGDLEEIILDARNNEVWDGNTSFKLVNIKNKLTDYVIKEVKLLPTLLETAINKDGNTNLEQLKEVVSKQQNVIKQLNAILVLLEDWENYQEVLKYLREILNDMEGIKNIIKEKKD